MRVGAELVRRRAAGAPPAAAVPLVAVHRLDPIAELPGRGANRAPRRPAPSLRPQAVIEAVGERHHLALGLAPATLAVADHSATAFGAISRPISSPESISPTPMWAAH